ncbi:MAG: hypothetical protein LW822_08640 [Phycisphaeraceae bacterium]|jgi:hypothetical protein|nr:hypothetical protein [Phycisphaeraceae bacterium]
MHNAQAEGNAFFVCDFCHNHFADDRPMVEGHKGALICGQCLTPAYTSLIHLGQGSEHAGAHCTMCLEDRAEAQWASPAYPDAHICVRCVKQGAGVLSKDPDFNWSKPLAPAEGSRVVDDEDLDPDVV